MPVCQCVCVHVHSDGGNTNEVHVEDYCQVYTMVVLQQQLNNKLNDVTGGFTKKFICEIEVCVRTRLGVVNEVCTESL